MIALLLCAAVAGWAILRPQSADEVRARAVVHGKLAPLVVWARSTADLEHDGETVPVSLAPGGSPIRSARVRMLPIGPETAATLTLSAPRADGTADAAPALYVRVSGDRFVARQPDEARSGAATDAWSPFIAAPWSGDSWDAEFARGSGAASLADAWTMELPDASAAALWLYADGAMQEQRTDATSPDARGEWRSLHDVVLLRTDRGGDRVTGLVGLIGPDRNSIEAVGATPGGLVRLRLIRWGSRSR